MIEEAGTLSCRRQTPWTPTYPGGAHARFDCRAGLSTDGMIAACLDCRSENSIAILDFIQTKIRGAMEENLEFSVLLEDSHIGTARGVKATKVVIVMDDAEHSKDCWSQDEFDVIRKRFPPSKAVEDSVEAMLELAALKDHVYGKGNPASVHCPLNFVKLLCTFLSLECLGIVTVSHSPLPLDDEIDAFTAHLLIGLVTHSSRGVVEPAAIAALRVLMGVSQGQASICPAAFIPSFIGTGTDRSGSLCRIMAGSTSTVTSPQSVSSWNIHALTLLETNLDDITSETLAFSIQSLIDNGAVDAWVTPIIMKKGRPAHTLSCLCESSDELVDKLLEVLFRQTTTLGVRIKRNIERAALRRKFLKIQTPYIDEQLKGIVDVKVGYLNMEVVSLKPEFDHCKVISLNTGVSIKRVSDYATAEAYKHLEYLFTVKTNSD